MAIPTEIISAIIGAASGGGVAWLAHRQDTFNARVQETHRALLDLVELRGQMLDSWSFTPERMEVLVQRRALLLAVAETLTRRTSRALTAHDWIALGFEALADRDFPSALERYERAVRASHEDDLLTQAIALRYLAALRYTAVGKCHDRAAGAAAYARAAELTSTIEDSYMLYNTGLSLAAWGLFEAAAGEDGARARLEEAKDCYRRAVARGYPQAQQALQQLEERERAGFTAPDPLAPPPAPHAAAPASTPASTLPNSGS